MIKAEEARKICEEARVEIAKKLEARARLWIEEKLSEKIENAAKQGINSVCMGTMDVLPGVIPYITYLLKEEGYKTHWRGDSSVTVSW